MSNKVILAYSSVDGIDLAAKIKELLTDEPVNFSEDINKPIDVWDAVVVLFVLTPTAFQDAELKKFAQKVHAQNLPLIPIVADLEERLSEQLPLEIKFLEESNIVELRSDTRGPELAQTVAGYLGLKSFAKDQKVFISYRRVDSQKQADKLYKYRLCLKSPDFHRLLRQPKHF